MEHLPSALRALRAARGLSQSDVARLSGLTQQTVSNAEAGIPSIRTIAKLADVYGLTPSELLDPERVARQVVGIKK